MQFLSHNAKMRHTVSICMLQWLHLVVPVLGKVGVQKSFKGVIQVKVHLFSDPCANGRVTFQTTTRFPTVYQVHVGRFPWIQTSMHTPGTNTTRQVHPQEQIGKLFLFLNPHPKFLIISFGNDLFQKVVDVNQHTRKFASQVIITILQYTVGRLQEWNPSFHVL